MRKTNAVISHLILLLFIVHGIIGAFNLMGVGSVTTRIIAWSMVGLICVHTVLGTTLTVQTLQAQKKAGVSYFKDNLLFWARRISGFLIMVLIFFHIFAFTGVSADHYRLPNFDLFKLITQILLVISIAFHIITNTKPLLIACGIKKLKPKVNDIVFWASILLLFMAVAFIIYYIRWSAI